MKWKNVWLFVVLALIVLSIFYLEIYRASNVPDRTYADIPLPDFNTTEDSDFGVETQERIEEKAESYRRAKELVSPDGYINTEKFFLEDFIGEKVILIDFWTYSCINCQRTFPYLISWDEKYSDQGLVIVGVHAPEFEFEKDYDNVVAATEKFGIEYSVVLDNNKYTWSAYSNRYWPRKYLIDIDGFIVYDHIGEGGYDETEREIQDALQERVEVLGLEEMPEIDLIDTGELNVETPSFIQIGTPEIYFGYEFQRNQMRNSEGWSNDEVVEYTLPANLGVNEFNLGGSWLNNPDDMELVSAEGTIGINYLSKNVNLVAGAEEPTTIDVYVDGGLINTITVDGYDLYRLYDAEDYSSHELILEVDQGLQAYTFTFG